MRKQHQQNQSSSSSQQWNIADTEPKRSKSSGRRSSSARHQGSGAAKLHVEDITARYRLTKDILWRGVMAVDLGEVWRGRSDRWRLEDSADVTPRIKS
ncbi:hypothetical protein CDL15_Pgr026269 [Punica granatum]|uniref:Uncharacterized protein n=1 Tax=Punica granatum TaxID=22663 RepID=A0A218XWS9_PUNGR|nr:hypothetical protein CDL15_Pgr026269 [Punica granatum]